jgi:hypothetical protein
MNTGAPTLFEIVWSYNVKAILIIEPFFQSELIEIATENYIRTWGHSWCCWKAFNK